MMPKGLPAVPTRASFLAISAAGRVLPATCPYSRTQCVVPTLAFQRLNRQTWSNTTPKKTLTSGAALGGGGGPLLHHHLDAPWARPPIITELPGSLEISLGIFQSSDQLNNCRPRPAANVARHPVHWHATHGTTQTHACLWARRRV
jgi:hypothetical protein